MKKLNNKGYMLVEIILASVIAFSVAYYLLNITYKFKDKNEDVYFEEKMLNDKINITKNIMTDLNKEVITSATCPTNQVELTTNTSDTFRIKLDTANKIITYGKMSGSSFSTTDPSYYTKKIDNFVELGTMTCQNYDSIVTIKIPLNNIYTDKTEEIKLFVKLNP